MVRFGVLGLLIERRGYGYELVQRLSARLGAAWHLNASAVYTALDQLESEGLIEPVPSADPDPSTRRSRRAGRVVYQVTDRGREEFARWLERPSERADPIRSELQLKVALAAPENVPPLLQAIAQEEWRIMQRLREECESAEQTRELLAPRESDEQSLAPERSTAWPLAVAALINEAATRRLQGELAWLESVRETLQRMTRDEFIVSAMTPGARGAGG